ncbi:hypothetical protein IMSHALPRED_010397 [Imshaugia aleurites]|uniref:Major facilitator superfamily (MFS) profile domain-containing protein n=1 Tax=Imshaugia aleurites TaxID=172621 RepID=A0A8H3IZ74_9LECA|nr:hypothetical protein IMSHALPRED_010397 [Imshaugia aleurites]
MAEDVTTNDYVQSWKGPKDPDNPRNWTKGTKWTSVLIISAQATISPIASTFLAVTDLSVADDFHAKNVFLPSLPVAVNVLGLGLGPLFLAPCSELYGRRIVFLTAFFLFTILNAGCAVAPNMAALALLRFLTGMAGSAGPGLGAGIVSDMFEPKERGKAQSVYGLGPQGGPVLGGVIGAFLLELTGNWRWLLWLMTMASIPMNTLSVCLLRETYEPVLLEWKAKRLRKETGDSGYRVENEVRPRELFLHAMTRPFRMLFTVPICTVLSLYTSLVVGIFFIQLTTLPLLYGPTPEFGLFSYEWKNGLDGLAYLGGGLGLVWATLIGIFGLNRSRKWMATHFGNGEGRPEFRLPLLFFGMLLIPIGLLLFGWSAQARAHWALPLLGAAIFSCGMQIAYVSIQVYTVDTFRMYAASALAANAVSRGVVGCILTILGFQVFESLGYGWGSSLLAFVALAALPVPVILYVYGPRLRKKQIES